MLQYRVIVEKRTEYSYLINANNQYEAEFKALERARSRETARNSDDGIIIEKEEIKHIEFVKEI